MKCKNCGKEYEHNNYAYPGFCSYACYEKWARFHKEPNCTCPVCGTKFYMKPYRIKRVKHQVCCSKECDYKFRSQWFCGKNNHQYGLLGALNSTFKHGIIKSRYGYLLVLAHDHPFRTCGNRVFQHRLVVEQNADLFDQKFFIEINGKKYLKEGYVVHHKNMVKTDNRVENLEIMTIGEHRSLHNKLKPLKHGSDGRFLKIGVSKSGNIGESCDANPEISTGITNRSGAIVQRSR